MTDYHGGSVRRGLAGVAVAVLLVATAACGGGGDQARDLGPGLHPLTFRFGDYVLLVPAGYDPDTPAPLVLVLHGSPGSAAGIHAASRLSRVAEQEGFLIAYPDNVNNVTAMRALVDEVQDGWNIAPGQVYAAGFSAGASASWRLAQAASDVFAAIAPVSGPAGRNLSTPEHPVPVITFIGLNDRAWLARMEGGLGRWYDQLGCEVPEPEWLDDTERASLAVATCPDGSEVAAYRMDKMTHVWPNDLAFGFSPNQAIWDFFVRHRRDAN